MKLITGDSLAELCQLKDNSIDAVVTDPPYELGFMGKTWDASGIAYSVELWREVLRVLKPGGHLLAFGGTRTYHRMTCAIEDAGFEIRDSMHWMYGTGFPKSLNVSKAIDEAGGEPTEQQARNLKARRETAGLSREQVAAAIGCTASSVRDWEEGRARAKGKPIEFIVPSAEYRAKLDEVLGYSEDARRVVGEADARGGDGTVIGLGHSGTLREGGNTSQSARWDGWGTALKPGHEPIVLARKPLEGTVAANVQKWGTGGLNIDGCRIEGRERTEYGLKNATRTQGAVYGEPSASADFDASKGRWPANVLLDEDAAAELDAQSGESRSPKTYARNVATDTSSRTMNPGATVGKRGVGDIANNYGDSGGASRFFYVAKPSRKERDLGCDALPAKSGGEATDREDDSKGVDNPRAGAGRTGGAKNYHPTVKPIALMRYLCRLVTPPGGTVLDPFTGSGTTGIAALQEGFKFVGIEREAEYVTLASARMSATQPPVPGETTGTR
jgi:DNA modification methylase/transcriptional regulator with XRE-family HTH domain